MGAGEGEILRARREGIECEMMREKQTKEKKIIKNMKHVVTSPTTTYKYNECTGEECIIMIMYGFLVACKFCFNSLVPICTLFERRLTFPT